MPPRVKGHRNTGTCTSVSRWRWLMVATGILMLYTMLRLQVSLWSATNRADLRANVISTDRDAVIINRSAMQPSEERLQRTAKPSIDNEVVEHPQTPTAVEAVKEQQNLRIVAPLSNPGAVVVSTPLPLVVAPANPIAAFGDPVASKNVAPSLADRHDVVFGYDAAMKYLADYSIPEGSNEQLFLFFVCGDEQGQQKGWRRVCVDASKLVYEVFTASPSRNRLLTIYAGSKQDWSTPNAFYKDGDLKVKTLPAIMQWHGGGPGAKRATSGMIIDKSLLYEPLLRYLFKNEDVPDPLLAPEKIASKEIVLLKGFKSYKLYMDTIAAGDSPSLTAPTGPMFLLFVAGRLESNDRPWCPYCRYSEISVEYAFYAFAPQGSRLVKVETVTSYSIWKNPTNEWKQNTELMVRGVPWMYRATLDTRAHTFSYARYQERLDYPDDLRGVFQGWKNPL